MLKPCHGVSINFLELLLEHGQQNSAQEVVLPSQLIWHFNYFKPFHHTRVTPRKHSFCGLSQFSLILQSKPTYRGHV